MSQDLGRNGSGRGRADACGAAPKDWILARRIARGIPVCPGSGQGCVSHPGFLLERRPERSLRLGLSSSSSMALGKSTLLAGVDQAAGLLVYHRLVDAAGPHGQYRQAGRGRFQHDQALGFGLTGEQKELRGRQIML